MLNSKYATCTAERGFGSVQDSINHGLAVINRSHVVLSAVALLVQQPVYENHFRLGTLAGQPMPDCQWRGNQATTPSHNTTLLTLSELGSPSIATERLTGIRWQADLTVHTLKGRMKQQLGNAPSLAITLDNGHTAGRHCIPAIMAWPYGMWLCQALDHSKMAIKPRKPGQLPQCPAIRLAAQHASSRVRHSTAGSLKYVISQHASQHASNRVHYSTA